MKPREDRTAEVRPPKRHHVCRCGKQLQRRKICDACRQKDCRDRKRAKIESAIPRVIRIERDRLARLADEIKDQIALGAKPLPTTVPSETRGPIWAQHYVPIADVPRVIVPMRKQIHVTTKSGREAIEERSARARQCG